MIKIKSFTINFKINDGEGNVSEVDLVNIVGTVDKTISLFKTLSDAVSAQYTSRIVTMDNYLYGNLDNSTQVVITEFHKAPTVI